MKARTLSVLLLASACSRAPGVAVTAAAGTSAPSCQLASLPTDGVTSDQLLAGAATDVPPSANAAYHSLFDGAPFHVVSAVTGVQFHVPGVPSSAPGGLATTPHPILKKADGVEYWFITGELSGLMTDDLGFNIVVGPIDGDGIDHRDETFCAACPPDMADPLCCAPGVPAAHPRAGLPGAFFALSIPRRGFNGALVQIEPAGDGGTGWPAAPLLFNPVDPVILLDRGYAVFTFGQGGTDTVGTLPDGTQGVDTNPDSGTGIFWAAPPADPNNGDFTGLASVARVAHVDEATGEEVALPGDYQVTLWDPGAGPDGTGGIFTFPLGTPSFVFGSFQWIPELISDSVLFAKNLMRELAPCTEVRWAAFVGWSGSGRPATMIASNTRSGAFQAPVSAGPQQGGGSYNVWGEPGSGLRYDAVLSYAGANDGQGYFDQTWGQSYPSRQFPIGPQLVWIVPEMDVTLPQAAAYIYANRVWRALDALGRGDEIDDHLRIYSLPGDTHQARDQLLASFDSPDGDGGLWYDVADRIPNPGAFNTARRGLRVSDAYAQAIPWNPPADGWDFFMHGKSGVPRHTAFWLQTLANLREHSTRGTPVPTSRVDSFIFNNLDLVTAGFQLPKYPLVPFEFPATDDEFFQLVYATEHAITVDSGIAANPLSSGEIDELVAFDAENPLARSTKPLLLPDFAAPLGIRFYFFDIVFIHPFDAGQLRKLYRSHGGWVGAFTSAAATLVGERLWEPALAASEIRQAQGR